MPDERISWTAYDGDELVKEVHDFVFYLEARHAAPATVEAYVRAVVKLGNFLAAIGKTFAELTSADLDQFLVMVARRCTRSDMVLPTAMLRPDRVEVRPALFNQILSGCQRFYHFFDFRQEAALFETSWRRRRSGKDGSYQPMLAHLSEPCAYRRDQGRKRLPTTPEQARRAATKRLTPDQVRRVISAATNRRDKLLVALLYATGLRIGEA